jgi:hypothetical protein
MPEISVLWIRDILVGIRIPGSVSLTDPDLALFVSGFQDVNNNEFFLHFLAFHFLKVHLHQSLKRKCHKGKSKNSRNQSFSYFFCLMMEGKNLQIRTYNTAEMGPAGGTGTLYSEAASMRSGNVSGIRAA